MQTGKGKPSWKAILQAIKYFPLYAQENNCWNFPGAQEMHLVYSHSSIQNSNSSLVFICILHRALLSPHSIFFIYQIITNLNLDKKFLSQQIKLDRIEPFFLIFILFKGRVFFLIIHFIFQITKNIENTIFPKEQHPRR